MANAIHLTDDQFQAEVLQSPIPALIDFWATWCGPCKMIAPIIEELAVEMEGKVKIFKMDVDSNPNVPIEYGIRSIPTILIFKNGELADTIVGAVPKKQIQERINAHL